MAAHCHHHASLHVWKVAANSAIDAQIQALVVYVYTYMKHHISILLYTLSSLGLCRVSCAEGLALQCSSFFAPPFYDICGLFGELVNCNVWTERN